MKNKIIYLYILISLISIIVVFNFINNNSYSVTDEYVYGLTAPRGRILDVNGNILVDNKQIKVIIANTYGLSEQEIIESVKELAKIIDIDSNVSEYNLKYYYYINNRKEVDNLISDEIKTKYKERKISSKELLEEKINIINDSMLSKIDKKEAYLYYLFTNGYSYQDKIIKEDISEEDYININNKMIKGIRTDITWERIYPYGDSLKQVFGMVSSKSEGLPLEYKDYYLKMGYNLNDRVGVSNLEFIYDDYLKGTKAKYVRKDGYLKLVSDYESGNDLVLSIDINIQNKAEKILEEEMILAKKAPNSKYFDNSYLIVSNPNNGEIMSLVGKKITKDNIFIDYSYNTILDSYAMGSAVKGASISVGYKYKLIDDNFKVKDACVKLYSQRDKCSWMSLGYIDDLEALRMSSNYFQYIVAIKSTGKEYKRNMKLNTTVEDFKRYRDVFNEYGLGVLTNIDLNKESSGVKGNIVSDDLLLNLSIGQYDAYTPIQLTSYIGTIATGERRKLSLVKYVIDKNGKIIYENKNEVYNKISEDDYNLNRIREGFSLVNKTGTGYYYTNHKFTSAGKTGTAEAMYGNVSVINTSYVMYAPLENPKFTLTLVSPSIKYQNSNSSYKYPINAHVAKKVSEFVYNYLSE